MQIQNTNVHTPRPMRGAIPRAQNLRFATVSRDRPTESYERFIWLNQNARFTTAACHPKCQNVRFATAACTKMYEMSAWRRQSPAAYKIIVSPQFRTSDQHEVTKRFPVELKNLHFTTVLDVRRARSEERVARAPSKFAFHHSFGRPTITFCVKGCFGQLMNLHFTTVLGVRSARNDERVASGSS